MTKTIRQALLLIFSVIAANAGAQSFEHLRINQVGLQPDQEKILVVDASISPNAKLLKKSVIIRGVDNKFKKSFPITRKVTSPISQKERFIVDFSTVNKPGKYEAIVGKERIPFVIAEHPLHEISKSALKAFYLIRSGVDIEEKYAGVYARKKAHADTHVLIHPSAATENRPEGTVISSPYGWYDAGDYNKYVVNSAFACAQMLMAYEQNKAYFDKLVVDIPESSNRTPDILDEVMFNLKWMLTMQDPDDGGVYHKLTTPSFEGMVMPADCHQQRYVVRKTVTAAYDFAAVMALAARIYKGNTDYPEFSAKASAAALKAYAWAKEHPNDFYRQNEMNKHFDPDVTTGEYGDMNARDEQFWASTELYLLTQEQSYLQEATNLRPQQYMMPVWGNVNGLGLQEWVATDNSSEMCQYSQRLLKSFCESLIKDVSTASFQSPYGNKAFDFGWGCLAEQCCNQAITLLYGEKYIEKGKYLKYALANANYLLGCNATGYCYVTGFGVKSPKNIHHRISYADGIDEPFPGLLAGGPNPAQQDKSDQLRYASNYADESYEDQTASYASNEIAINWNSALVSMMGGLDAASMK